MVRLNRIAQRLEDLVGTSALAHCTSLVGLDFSLRIESADPTLLGLIVDKLYPSLSVGPERSRAWRLRVLNRDAPDLQVEARIGQRVEVATSLGAPALTGQLQVDADSALCWLGHSGVVVFLNSHTRDLIVAQITTPNLPEQHLPHSLAEDAQSAVRILLRRHLETRGALLIHGATVEVNDVGLLLVGPKGSGKTTAQMMILREFSGRYCSGDRTFVTPFGARVIATGWPDAVRFTRETATLVERLADLAGERPMMAGKHIATSGELEQAFGVQCCQAAAIGATLFLSREPSEPSLRTISPRVAKDALRMECLTPNDPVYHDWMSVGGRWSEPEDGEEVYEKLVSLPMMALAGSWQIQDLMAAVTRLLGKGVRQADGNNR